MHDTPRFTESVGGALADMDCEERAEEGRPRYVNFFHCSKDVCSGLCYNHHPYCDAKPFLKEEIMSCVCIGNCAREFCHRESCRCFWKSQNEILNSRLRIETIKERHRQKCKIYEEEIETIKDSQTPNKIALFTDEIQEQFTESFKMLKNLEHVISSDFLNLIKKTQIECNKYKKINERLLNDNSTKEKKIQQLEHENTCLRKNLIPQRKKKITPY